MNELEYVRYVKLNGSTRMLLNPLMIDDIADLPMQFYDMIETRYPDLEPILVYNSLDETPIAIDVNERGDLLFLYMEDEDLRWLIENMFDLNSDVIITSDPDFEYVRPSDLDQLIFLRDSFTRQ